MSGKESGMVLVQVLGIVAFASAIAVTMLALQDRAARYATLARDRLQAEALARAGETSVIVAFQRDAKLNPLTDHYGEPWYAVSQAPIETLAGRFSVVLTDAQSKFNLNRLANGVSDRALFNRMAASAGLAPETGDRISAGLARDGELSEFSDLALMGFSAAEIDALAVWTTVLPSRAELNLNTASPVLVEAALANPVAASQLVARREGGQGIAPTDLGGLGILVPPGAGLVTDHLEVQVDVESGSVRVRLQSLIARERRDGEVEAFVVTRRWN